MGEARGRLPHPAGGRGSHARHTQPGCAIARALPRDLATYLRVRDEGGKPRRAQLLEAMRRAGDIGRAARAEVLALCRGTLRPGERLPWARLGREERENVVAMVVSTPLSQAAGDPLAPLLANASGLAGVEVFLEDPGLVIALQHGAGPGGAQFAFSGGILIGDDGLRVRPGPGW
ncbi:MAG: hypothetical protein IT208_02450 [Chthonomonadales bacterium]|nr:hypothetical protein [Chthonomonadales bacterium]